jgi:periplasmic divalent cation tolerance protein
MTDAIIVLTTAGSDEQADSIASALVEEKLAACVNVIGGVKSVYRWKGEIEKDNERLLVIKTTEDLFDAVRRRIRELHSYELPEVIALPISDGDPDYLAWLCGEVRSPEDH